MRTLGAVAVFAGILAGQTGPRFDAASVKAAAADAPRVGRMMTIGAVTTQGRLTMRNASVTDMVKAGYSVEDYQVLGGSPWMGSARFDVEGKSGDGAARERLLVMLRTLLAERFQLDVHRETKEMAVYSMTVAKGGPKFRALKPEEVACWPMCSGMNEGHGESFAAEGSAFTGAVSYAFGVGSAGDR